MNNVIEFPKNPAIEAAIQQARMQAEAQAQKEEAIRQAMANAEIITVTIEGYLKERDPDGTVRVVKQEFQAPVPKGTTDFSNAAGAVWQNFSNYGGLNIPEPNSTSKFHFFPMGLFEKLTLEFGHVSGVTLS